MGNQSVQAVLRGSKAPPSARLLLLILAHHRNDVSGRCDPSVRLLAEESGLKPRQVQRNLRELVGLGEVVRIERMDQSKGQLANFYRIPCAEEYEPRTARKTSPPDGARDTPPTTTDATPGTSLMPGRGGGVDATRKEWIKRNENENENKTRAGASKQSGKKTIQEKCADAAVRAGKGKVVKCSCGWYGHRDELHAAEGATGDLPDMAYNRCPKCDAVIHDAWKEYAQ